MPQSPLLTQKTRNFAHKALKALRLVSLNRLFESPQPVLAVPMASVRLGTGAHDAVPASHTFAEQAPRCGFQIAREDWDALFRAVQARLAHAVDVQRGWLSAPQAGDAADHLQTVVLECVTDMAQLQAALAHEHACTDVSGGLAGQS